MQGCKEALLGGNLTLEVANVMFWLNILLAD